MEEMRAGPARVPLTELQWRFSRSSGPGGQNVNKRDTRVEVVFDLASSPSISAMLKARAQARLGTRLRAGRISVTASTARTQAENRRLAIERLSEVLGEALRPPPKQRRPTKPSAGAKERRLAAKRVRGEVKRARRRPITESE